ncbi:MAG: Na+/H+ antiporter subunit E [Eubacterium sp.]|nr:Na+/H+ antiporter subunit E [Eubacterium sp.]
MKKTSVAGVTSTAIVCYLFWLFITGQIVDIFRGKASAQVLIVGAIVAIGAAIFSSRFFIHEKAGFLWNPARLLNLIAYSLVIFPIELVKANVDVAKRALSPKLPVNPGFVKIPSKVKSEYGQAMLADSITLTPGTITMDITEEDGQTNYYIHWIDVASEDPQEAGEAIKGTLEKWVRRIWE